MCCEALSGALFRSSLSLPEFLGGAAPEGFQAVVIAGLVGEDVDDHVGEVEADPGRPLLYALGARAVAILDHLLYDLLGHAPGLALGLGAGYDEVVRVRDEPPQVHQSHGFGEHLARRPGRRGGHLVAQRLALRLEAPLPDGGLVATHRVSSFKRPPCSLRLPSPSYNLLSLMISYTPSGTRYRTLLPCSILRRIPVAEMSTRVHSTGKIRSKFLKPASRWPSLPRSYPGRVAATMTTSSSNRSGSFQASRFETSSAPLMKYQSSPGERSFKTRTVSTLRIGRPASISTLSTKNRSLAATAASTMSKRSSAGARTLEASLWGGIPPGTNTTRERPSSPMTCSAMIMCPWWTGSKVPPKIPTLKMRTSSEVEHRLADPDLVARRRAGAAQGAQDAPPLELALKALDTLGVLPVRFEGEPLDTLAKDHVGAVFALYPYAPPHRTEHAVSPPSLLVAGGLLP